MQIQTFLGERIVCLIAKDTGPVKLGDGGDSIFINLKRSFLDGSA